MNYLLSLLFLFFSFQAMSQTTVSGTVVDEEGEPIPGLIVRIEETKEGTVTDASGNFSFSVQAEPPFTVSVKGVGYAETRHTFTSGDTDLNLTVVELENELQQVVISASRVPERLFESPVSIEQMSPEDIANTSSPSFYDGLENLKGVDVNTGSFTFKSVNTRGFATLANERFVQLVDGMDNSSPALNFALGNLLGMSELDVERIELLPGASSALYGANAFNGILFMTSKSPFTHQGVSAYVKGGIMNQFSGDNTNFFDVGIRYAHAFSDKVAIKFNLSDLEGTEWRATDYNDYITGANSRMDPGYNGLNIYGDEVATTLNFRGIAIANGIPEPVADALGLGSSMVSRTGYNELDLMDDYGAQSLKGSMALHIKPNADDFEIILNSRYGKGNTIYQGANRYYINNFHIWQNKLELRNDNFFVRGYMTTEDAGDSYDSRFAAINLNRDWKSDSDWFSQYASVYLGAMTGQIPGTTPGDSNAAHAIARGQADTGRYEPGSAEFNQALNRITNDPSLLTGAKFVDNTKLYHVDANYNFRDYIDWADLQVGGSYRRFSLNSDGTIFTDYDGAIPFNEYGLYTQLQKRFAQDKLKFTGSLRYDKSQNFDGNVSPRLSLVFSPDENKDHNIRASFQTGFRNPTTQDQYIGLDAGQAILIGSAPDNIDRYTSRPLAVSPMGQAITMSPTIQLNGRVAYENSFTRSSVEAFAASAAAGTPNPALLEAANPEFVEAEKVTAYELGYRAALGRNTFLDISGYINQYEDFIAEETVIAPYYGSNQLNDPIPTPVGPTPLALIALSNGDIQPFQTYTNADTDINSHGINLGINTTVGTGYELGFNYTWTDFDFDQDANPDFRPLFNTPEHRAKAQFGHQEIVDNFGFNINWRWNDSYFWESSFVDATIPARNIVDAQLSYNIDSIHSKVKLGAANIFNHHYESVPGAGTLGAQYFIGFTYGE